VIFAKRTNLLVLAVFCGAFAGGQTPPAPGRPQVKGRPISVTPFTLDRVVGIIRHVKNGDLPEAALVKRLTKDGISFQATIENVMRLREAGASETLIQTVQKLAPAPPPLPVIPVVVTAIPKGSLALNCSPAECDVNIGPTRHMRTVSGKLHVPDLEPGEVSVEVLKDGFAASKVEVKIVAEETTTVSATLEPTSATLRVWGEDLRRKAVDALGGAAGLHQSESLFGSGDCTIWGRDGNAYQSSIQLIIRLPEKLFFSVRAGKTGVFEADYIPAYRARTRFPEQEARELDAGLRLLKDYQLSTLFDRINSKEVTITANASTTTEFDGATFQASSSTETLTVVLNAQARPKEIREDSAVGKGVRAEYSEYRWENGTYIPATVFILWPGSSQQGIKIHLREISLNGAERMESLEKRKRRWWLW